jgi:hypothetical protein
LPIPALAGRDPNGGSPEVLDRGEQRVANGIRVLAYPGALVVADGGLVAIADYAGWSALPSVAAES